MQPTVHILATVRKAELLPATLLVFKSLRTGFPSLPVCVWGNALAPAFEGIVAQHAARVGARFANGPATSHDAWIEMLAMENLHPFWICDTDIVFWSSMEAAFKPRANTLFAGRFEPEFMEEWTDTRHMARLHTALMYFNPALSRAGMRAWMAKIPPPFGHTGQFPFIRQQFIPLAGMKPLFYDTCAGLYHALGGTRFTEKQDDCFDHLHCSTYLDEIAPHLSAENFEAGHIAVYANPAAARGARHAQDKYYARRRPRKPLFKGKEQRCHTAQE